MSSREPLNPSSKAALPPFSSPLFARPTASSITDPSPARQSAALVLTGLFSSTTASMDPSPASTNPYYVEPSTPYENMAPEINISHLEMTAPPKKRSKKAHATVSISPPTSRKASLSSSSSSNGSGMEDKYSRKDKSLGLLCLNFAQMYPEKGAEVSIDLTAQSLGVERRRIYDIINILESVDIVTRKCKNTYTWNGTSHLTQTFRRLQWDGVREAVIYPNSTVLQIGSELQLSDSEIGRIHTTPADEIWFGQKYEEMPPSVFLKEKSLARLSQRFLQMFLLAMTTPSSQLSLSSASNIILSAASSDQSSTGMKTKVRRLYDIANVMVALDVIEKVPQEKGRSGKPSFQWCWPVGVNELKHPKFVARRWQG